MVWLTAPVLAEQTLHLLVGLSDLWLAGNVVKVTSDERVAYVAAMTLMIYALWLVGNVFSVVAVGSTAMIARFVCAVYHHLRNRVMNQSITTGLALSGLLMAVAIPLAGCIPPLMGLKGLAAD